MVSPTLAFDVQRFPWTDPVAGGDPSEGFDLVLSHGAALVDIDDWLEALFRDHLEDAWIQHIVFFRWNGDWMGMIVGLGRTSGHTRRAYFDLTKNEIRFPAPLPLNKAGHSLVPDG